MDLGLNGKCYLVTGASSGLGFASAQALAADGARLVIASRDKERIDAAAAAIRQQGPDVEVRPDVADLADPSSAERLVNVAQQAYGRLDGAVISVGGPAAGTVKDASEDDWRSAFESVFLGGLRMAKAVLATLDSTAQSGEAARGERASCAVTLILSSSVKSPIPSLAISNGLRPGLAMAAKTLADEYGSLGGRVNVLLPGRIDTDRVRHLDGLSDDPEQAKSKAESNIPLGRYGTPEEFGRVAAFVTSPAASYLSGVAIPVDGGLLRSL